jgi:GNAT superfamily N-acetyltransferase
VGIAIRLGTPTDAAAVSAFVTPIVQRFIAHEFEPDAQTRFLETFTPSAINGYFEKRYRYHIAESEQAIVGVVATRDNCHVYHLFVAESLHGSGLGRRLWLAASQASRAAGHNGDFTVNSSRFAVGFYERLGFDRDGPAHDFGGIISFPMRLRAPAA